MQGGSPVSARGGDHGRPLQDDATSTAAAADDVRVLRFGSVRCQRAVTCAGGRSASIAAAATYRGKEAEHLLGGLAPRPEGFKEPHLVAREVVSGATQVMPPEVTVGRAMRPRVRLFSCTLRLFANE